MPGTDTACGVIRVAADVYAFAVLLCEVYGRSDPYEGQDSALVLEQVLA